MAKKPTRAKKRPPKTVESPKFFRTVFERSPVMMAITALKDGRFLDVNNASVAVTGYSRVELLRMRTIDLGFFKDLRERETYAEEFRKKGSLQGKEVRGRTKSGVELMLLASVERITFRGESALLVVLQDVTDRRIAQAKIREGLDKLQNVIGGIINAISKLVELRDPYTAGHQRRVSHLAVAIARELGITGDQLDGIRLAGLIHDVGKLYVPAEILGKPGILSELEFELIKIHPQAGYEILKNIEFPWPVAKVALQHQERLDGSGYPVGLSGDAIPLETRIVSVADVVEAMTFHRPYRTVVGLDQALEEILKHRGTLYDEQVVDICVRLFREKKFSFE